MPPETSNSSRETTLVDYAKSLDCIHCGLCLQTCPTFRLTGAEPSSPRGRIHLMRAVGEGRQAIDDSYAAELDLCLLCRHCESVCPAGVRFGEMMGFARARREAALPRPWPQRLARFVGLRLVLPNRLLLRLAGSFLRLLQVTGLERLASRVEWLGTLGAGLADLPRIPSLSARRLLPERSGAGGDDREVAFLQGCVMPELYARVNRATVTSLRRLGFSCTTPPEVVCCGSLHAHNGDHEGARALAERMIESFERTGGGTSPIVVNSAGCGAHMRECAHVFPEGSDWHRRAVAFQERVVDYSELVADELEKRDLTLAAPALPGPVTWDDPCHLCHAQGVRRPPRAILERIEGLERVELTEPEACCGSAGLYSLTHGEESRAVFERKLEDLERSGARTVITANPGCQLQWESGVRRAGKAVRVVHLAEVVGSASEERE